MKRVVYFYEPTVGNFYYGADHPMKPFRIKMAHQLIVNYGLYRSLNVFEPHYASSEEMEQFHSPEYIKYIKNISPAALRDLSISPPTSQFHIGESDCPAFEGLYSFAQISCGGSVDAAMLLNNGYADVCINWAGGLHHAKKAEAEGFCYANDIVLGILELLKYNDRVLYVDIDVHHGDGVEEAFYCTDRVMTVSFHKFGDFFPGTGDLTAIGAKDGKYYTLNVPLRSGMDDESYVSLFKTIMGELVPKYRPSKIVMQCGADSLAWDRLGPFNLTLRGHGECVKFMKEFGIPMLVLGGGGYTIKNVSRCWTYETGILLGKELDNNIPANDYYEYYAPHYQLHLSPKNESNLNTPEYLEILKVRCLEHIKFLDAAPSVPFMEAPGDFMQMGEVEKKKISAPKDIEFYESNDKRK